MKQYQFDSFDGPESLTLKDAEKPEPQRGEVLIKVHASSLNFRDLAIARGEYGGGSSITQGLVPLSDGAGEVVGTGPDVSEFKEGDRVAGVFLQKWQGGAMTARAAKSDLGGTLDGMLAEYVTLREGGVVKIPNHLSYAEAATLPCAGITAWHALRAGNPLQSGDTVLVLGSGGVSVFALQFARSMGARVVATTSKEEKVEKLKALGASDVVNYEKHPDWHEKVRSVTDGKGADRVVEIGGAGTLERSLRSAGLNGHVVLIGVLTGADEINPMPILQSSLNVHGILTGSREMFRNMNAAIENWGLNPVIDREFAFDDAPEAYGYLASGQHIGKVVINHP